MADCNSRIAERSFEERNAGVIFSKIASLASCVERLGILLVMEPGDAEMSARRLRTRRQSRRSRARSVCLRTSALRPQGSVQPNGVNPAEWLLPPVFLR
jgi:hypothetical protein